MRALIIRHCAFGDAIHCSHLPRLLSEQGFKVDVNTNYKGYQVFVNNPFIDNLFPEELNGWAPWLIEKHWQVISEGYDKVINLYGSIERGLLAMEDMNEYYMSQEVRNNRYAGINYYDQTTHLAGYPQFVGDYKGEMFFTDEEEKIVLDWVNLPKFDGKKLVIINLAGSGPHKRFVQAKEVASKLLESDKDIHIITTASEENKSKDFSFGDRTTSIVGKFPFRQAALIVKYVDCVIGCESGLMCVSAMFNTPTVQLMTATDINAHNKYNKNDYSLQSPCRCSPCYKGPYRYYGCPSKDGNPLCVYFDTDKIVENTMEALNARVMQ